MTGNQYKAAREKLGLTQAQLADKLGVTRKTIGYRESKKTVPREAVMAIEVLVEEQQFAAESTPRAFEHQTGEGA